MIRQATIEDAEYIMHLAVTFSKQYGVPRPSDKAAAMLNECIYNGSVFVEDRNGVILGCMVGHVMPHPFMDYTVLATLFFYSVGYEGLKMIRRFIQYGREQGVDAINASTHAKVNSERDRRLMTLLGFEATEVGWHLNL
jgi:N-acetylglutamate synthase-like GNAT family acetyltransferase